MRKKRDKGTKAKNDPANAAPVTQEIDPQDEADGTAAGEAVDRAAVDDAPGDSPEVPQEDTLESLQAKVAALEDALLRAKADYQNLQRRTTNERAEAVRYGNAELMRSLLGVADDLERSIAAGDKSGNVSAVVDGIRLVHGNFLQALRNHGLEVIEALHQPFDPHVHEAMLQQPSEEHPDGTVIEVTAKGYRLRDRVVRPAKVIVAKAVGEQETKKRADSSGEDKEPEGPAAGEA